MEQKTSEQWEYYNHYVDGFSQKFGWTDYLKGLERLKELGREGWEAYAVKGTDQITTYYLKRRVQKGGER